MEKGSVEGKGRRYLLVALFLVLIGIFSWIFIFSLDFQTQLRQGWRALTQESKRILGWEKGEIPAEEKRMREEVILKKMEEASIHQDWRSLAPEYPRPKKLESSTAEEKSKTLKNSPEFREMDKELKEYLKRKEDLFYPEAPTPSLKDATDLSSLKDKGAEKIIERLQSKRDGNSQERPLEENLRLGMKGPLVSRKILEKPQPPQVKVKVEAEIELTLWVLPSGTVDRVVPSVKGDTELERIAIQYLKQWRFAPLSKDHPQVEEWGTIPIKFRLQ
ncbi:MAG TPA: TonB family protein [Thermodesulfobacteriota bacterium]|jgi:TonB family protein|nr:TonB family protein [Thermodesulfobacteriota bacterium]